MNDNKSPKDAATFKQKDYVTNKLLLVFTFAFALLMLLMNIGRMMKSTTTFVAAMTTVRSIAIAACIATVLGVVMLIMERVKGKDTKYKLLCGKNITIASLFIAICTGALSLVFSQSMLMLLYIFIPAVIVLYIIYYSYQREFFMIAISCIIGGIGIWLLRSDLINTGDMLALVASGALIVLLAAITILAQLGHGEIKLFGKELNVFKSDARYGIVYLTFILVLLLLAASLLAADLAIYFLFGLLGYIVLTGVYYTMKLI